MGDSGAGRADSPANQAELGLSAIELAVVVAILAMLAALAAIGVTGMNESAIGVARASDVAEVQKAIDRWAGEQPASRYPVATPVIVDVNNTVWPSAVPARNGLAQKGSSLYARVVFTDGFTNPEGSSRSFVPDFLQRLPKHAKDEPMPWVIDENGTVKLLATTGAATPTPTPTSTVTPTPTVQAVRVPTLVGTASLPATPRRMAVNSATNRVFVAVGNSWNASTYYVSVITDLTNTANIAVGTGDYSTGPIWIAINDATNRVYVAHTGSNFADAINASTNSVIGTIATGAYPEGIVTNPLTNHLYVANTNSGNVSVFNTASDANMLITTIAIPGAGAGITNLYLAIMPATNRMYVSAPGLNKVFVVDTTSNTVIDTFTRPLAPSGAIVANATTNRLYLGSDEAGRVDVVDAATGASITSVSIGSGSVAYLAVNTTLNRVYAMSSNSTTLAVIDGTSNGVGALEIGATGYSLAADAANGRVYVATSANSVAVLSE